MRRKDREVTENRDKLAILKKSKVMQLAMVKGEAPYVVNLNFGYTFSQGALALYFHSAKTGKKADILALNNRVCFTVSSEYQLVPGETACDYGCAYESVVGVGRAVLLGDTEAKKAGLNAIMAHQTGSDREFPYTEGPLQATAVYRIDIDKFTAKRREMPGGQR